LENTVPVPPSPSQKKRINIRYRSLGEIFEKADEKKEENAK
jgi:hypothetical protein